MVFQKNDIDPQIREAMAQMDQPSIVNAFQAQPFVYGTQGARTLSKIINKWYEKAYHSSKKAAYVTALSRIASLHQADMSKVRTDKDVGWSGLEWRELNFFEPGRRAAIQLSGQMMDLYYGQGGTVLHERRDPAIGEFVHRAMNFTGTYDPNVSGRDAYFRTHGEDAGEGWLIPPDGPRYTMDGAGVSATKYMSHCIRQGIMYYGGTLVFEGMEVFYRPVATTFTPAADLRDTELEAKFLFPFFVENPTPSAKVPFGNGHLIFHWGGFECVLSQVLLESNWQWSEGKYHQPANRRTGGEENDERGNMEPWWDRLPATHESALQAKTLAETQWATLQNT